MAALRLIFGIVLLAVCVAGCDKTNPAAAGLEIVKINGQTFYLEVANNDQMRFQGLSDRDFIEPDGGMLFVFTRGGTRTQQFVMRDCTIPIDIIFLDPSGRVTAAHEMVPEPPQEAGESDQDYNARLKKYSSRFPAQFVIELKGGTLPSLNLNQGDQIKLDTERLKREAR